MVEQINSIAQLWWSWMWPMFWQVSLLIAIIALADLLLRKRVWPQVRYALWLLVLIKLVIPPGFALSTSIVSQVRAHLPQKNIQTESENIPEEISSFEIAMENILPDIQPRFEPIVFPKEENFVLPAESISQPYISNPITVPEKPKFDWKSYLMTGWLAGVAALLFWAVMRYKALQKRFCTKTKKTVTVHGKSYFCHCERGEAERGNLKPSIRLRLLRPEGLAMTCERLQKTNIPKWFEPLLNETANRLKLQKIPQIAFSNNISSPAVFGTFKPVLVLPVDISLSQKNMEHILLHELAHIKRLDLKINTITTLLQIVHWFNPLLFFAGKRLRHLRELCCDATVAGILREQTSDYRMTIMESARRFFTKPTELGMGLLGLFEDSSSLSNRLKWLEKKTWKYRTLQIFTVFTVVTLMTLYILPMAKAKKAQAAETTIAQEEQTDDSEIDPREMITCTGKIINNKGKPVEGAKITVYERFKQGSVIFRQVGKTVASNADGKFVFKTKSIAWIMRSFEGMDEFEQALVVIQKDGHAIEWSSWDMNSDINMNIILTKAQSIEGIVIDETGKSVPNAEVHAIVYKSKQSAADISNWLPGISPVEGLQTTTDTRGRFKISNIPEGCFVDLFIKAKSKAITCTYHNDLGPAFKAGQKNVRAVVADEGRIEGRIIDLSTGKGVPGLKITVTIDKEKEGLIAASQFSANYYNPLVCISKEDGTFSIGELPEGKYILLGEFPSKHKVFVEKGKTTSDVTIECPAIVYGRVMGPDGKPYADADVQIRQVREPGNNGGIAAPNIRTDRFGKYIYADISWPYTMGVLHHEKFEDGRGYRGNYVKKNETFEGTQQVNFQLGNFPEGTANLAGEVKDQNDQPVTEFIVQLNNKIAIKEKPGQSYSDFGITQIFYTNDGKFEFGNLPGGEYTVSINSLQTNDQYEFPFFQETILEKDKTTAVKYDVIKKQSYYGRVLFDDGTPAYFDPPPWPIASVTITVPTQIGDNTISIDKDGYFEAFLKDEQYESIKNGTFRMNISVPSLESERLFLPTSVSFPSDKLAKDKSRAGVVKIPKSSYESKLNPENAPSLLQKELPGFTGIEINQNSEKEDNKNITVRGYVTDKLGRPRGNVFITPEGINIWDGKRSDLQGHFVLENIKPEQKKWVAYSQSSRALGLFTIPDNYDGTPIHVILDFVEASVEGRVITEQGRGLPGQNAELIITTKDGLTYIFPSSQRTDLQGNYENGILPFGPGLKIQAKLTNTREEWKKYITEAVEIPENQIFIQMPALVIGEGKPEESDDGKILYGGRIVNEEGKPLANTKVEVYYQPPGQMSIMSKFVMTDSDGRWKRRVPANGTDISVHLTHPEYIRQTWQKVSIDELRNGTNVIVMKRGIKLSGIVKNERGEPIENALVDTGGGEGWTPYGEVLENHTTPRTISDGSFSVGGLEPESKNIVVSAFGYAPRNVPLDIIENMKPVEITLSKGKTYTGQVVDANDNPIEAVHVELDEWNIGNARHSIINMTQTDVNGIFKLENLPDEGTIKLYYAKSKSGLIGFRKELPEDFPEIGKVVMYKVPVFTGKVIDAETEKPITRFSLTSGIESSGFGDSIHWSKYYKEEVRSATGSFTQKWSGYAISYPFDGLCQLRVEAEGYLSEAAPPLKLGEEYEPAVIRLTKGEIIHGIITDNESKPIRGAEVGWIGHDKKAFITNGKFDQRGFSDQTEFITRTNTNGEFKLPPSRDEGLIVVVHENNGYASISSDDFENGSQIKLKPWAKIEGTIISSNENRKEYNVLINMAISDEELSAKKIRWMFDRTSFSRKNFVINHIPAEPVYICQYIDSEMMKREYLEPQPGQTYKVELSDEPGIVSGRIIEPEPLEGKELPKMNDIEISEDNVQPDNGMTLICFWDFEQRPSRNMITQLNKRIQELEEKGISVMTINTSDTEQKVLDDWLKEQNINLKVGKITTDVEKTKFNWGVKSLPWLILTDENHIVLAEGFNLEDLDKKISDGIEEIYNSPETPSNVGLKGKVLTQDGKPVAGVTVYLGNTYITKDSSIEWQMNESAQPTWQGGEFEPAYLETDSDGGFVFDKLSHGKTDIWAEHPEFGICWLRDISSDKKDVQLILKPQQKIIKYTGQVTDIKKQPVSDAKILIYTENDRNLIGQTKCNKRGIFEIEVEPPWKPYRHLTLLCTSENNPPAWKRLLYASAENLQIKLKEQTQISGKVVDSEGKGITGAKILFFSVEDTDYGEIFFSRRDEIIQVAPSTKTDNNGNFTIRQVPLGSTISLRAEHPEYTSEIEKNISAIGQEVKIEDIQLPDGATIEGTVHFADTKKPAQGVTVKATSFNRAARQTVTDNNGKYFLKGIEDIDLYEIISVSAEYPEENPQWAGQIEIENDLSAGDHLTGIDITLKRSFEYRKEIWLAQQGEMTEGPPIVVLHDSDPEYNGKKEYEDTLSLYNSNGKQQWQIKGFNTCQSIGSNNSIIYNPIDKSIWCAEEVGNRLIKMDIKGNILLELEDIKPNSLAVDPKTGNLWVLTSEGTIYGENLIVFNPSGQKIKEYSHKGFNIAYSQKDNCFWIVGKEAFEINKDGQEVNRWPDEFAWVAVSVNINNKDGSVWISEGRHSQVAGSNDRILILELDGKERKSIELEHYGRADIVIDSQRNVAWAATRNGILKMNLDGDIIEDIPLRGFSICIEPETGYVLVASNEGIYRLDSNGKLVWSKETPGGSQKWLCAIPD